MLDSKVRHKIVEYFKETSISLGKYYGNVIKERFPKSWTVNWANKSAVVEKATSTLQKINPEALTKLAKSRIGKTSITIAAGIAAWSLGQHLINNLGRPSPKIPEHNQHGYDLLKEELTDFGSPVKLAKTASKAITPYFSSTRSAFNTTTSSVIKGNLALRQHSQAIRHNSY